MFLTRRIKQVAVGLTAMGIAFSTFGFTLSTTTESFFGVVRGLQLMATVALLFGVFKEDALHKDKLLLIWLAITTILFSGLCRESVEIIPSFIYYYPIYIEYLLGLIAVLALLACLMYVIYREYVELNQIKGAAATETSPLLQTKDQPPHYTHYTPTSDNQTILI